MTPIISRAAAGAALALAVVLPTLGGQPIAYPEGYRDWTHVKSMVIQPGHPLFESFGGIHHIYANETARAGYRSGTFDDGSIIIFDLLDVATDGNAISETERKVLGVMVRDRARFADTGGWGFEGFAGGDPARPVVGDQAAEACYSCHTARKDNEYVFSEWRD